jgi:hypothetical protein
MNRVRSSGGAEATGFEEIKPPPDRNIRRYHQLLSRLLSLALAVSRDPVTDRLCDHVISNYPALGMDNLERRDASYGW